MTLIIRMANEMSKVILVPTKNNPLAWPTSIAITGRMITPLKFCASWYVLTLDEMRILNKTVIKVTIGERKKISASHVADGKIIVPNNGYPSELMMIPDKIKLTIDTRNAGIKEAITLLTNSVLIETGENSKLSSVLLSFSPTKLLAATVLAVIMGINKNKDGNK